MHIDGQEVYAIDDWPTAWTKPGDIAKRTGLVLRREDELRHIRLSPPVYARPVVAPPAISRHGTRNVCSNDGFLVDSRALSSDPIDHDVPGLPKLGCTNLMCGLCYQKVRSVGGVIPRNVHGGIDTRALYEDLGASTLLEPSTLFRLYVCKCAYHIEGGEHELDDNEGVQVATQWTCVGHPIAELPHELDGVSVTAENLAEVVARALANELPPNLRKTEQRDGVWAARLAIRLDGTPHQEAVVAAAAAHLMHPDARIRSRAVQFFVHVPHFAKHMHADVLLGRHPELFVGVANPLGVLRVEKTLEFLLWRELAFAPVEFPRRLANLIPPPRAHLARYHGIFAPNHHRRHAALSRVPSIISPLKAIASTHMNSTAPSSLAKAAFEALTLYPYRGTVPM